MSDKGGDQDGQWPWYLRVLQVCHVSVGSTVQGVDDHLGVTSGAGDLHPSLRKLGDDGRTLPRLVLADPCGVLSQGQRRGGRGVLLPPLVVTGCNRKKSNRKNKREWKRLGWQATPKKGFSREKTKTLKHLFALCQHRAPAGLHFSRNCSHKLEEIFIEQMFMLLAYGCMTDADILTRRKREFTALNPNGGRSCLGLGRENAKRPHSSRSVLTQAVKL